MKALRKLPTALLICILATTFISSQSRIFPSKFTNSLRRNQYDSSDSSDNSEGPTDSRYLAQADTQFISQNLQRNLQQDDLMKAYDFGTGFKNSGRQQIHGYVDKLLDDAISEADANGYVPLCQARESVLPLAKAYGAGYGGDDALQAAIDKLEGKLHLQVDYYVEGITVDLLMGLVGALDQGGVYELTDAEAASLNGARSNMQKSFSAYLAGVRDALTTEVECSQAWGSEPKLDVNKLQDMDIGDLQDLLKHGRGDLHKMLDDLIDDLQSQLGDVSRFYEGFDKFQTMGRTQLFSQLHESIEDVLGQNDVNGFEELCYARQNLANAHDPFMFIKQELDKLDISVHVGIDLYIEGITPDLIDALMDADPDFDFEAFQSDFKTDLETVSNNYIADIQKALTAEYACDQIAEQVGYASPLEIVEGGRSEFTRLVQTTINNKLIKAYTDAVNNELSGPVGYNFENWDTYYWNASDFDDYSDCSYTDCTSFDSFEAQFADWDDEKYLQYSAVGVLFAQASETYAPFDGSGEQQYYEAGGSSGGGGSGDFSETHYSNWGDSLSDSLTTAILGFCLIFFSLPFLWFNERRSVQTSRIIDSGYKICEETDSSQVDSQLEGDLVHVTAESKCIETLYDEDFGVRVENCAKLKRQIEVYQMKESSSSKTDKDHFGGGKKTTTTYHYSPNWSSSKIDSSKFKDPKHRDDNNRVKFFTDEEIFTAKKVSLDAYNLSASQIDRMSNYKDIILDRSATNQFSKKTRDDIHRLNWGQPNIYVEGNYVYIKQSHGQESRIGDIRISFSKVPCEWVTVVAEQAASTFVPYNIKRRQFKQKTDAENAKLTDSLETGCCHEVSQSLDDCCFTCCYCCKCADKLMSTPEDIDWLYEKKLDKAGAFESQRDSNRFFTTLFRLLGIGGLWLGIYWVFAPIIALLSVVKILADIVGFAIGLCAFLIALAVGFVVIAISWVFYRPIVGLSLLAIAGGIWLLIYYYQ